MDRSPPRSPTERVDSAMAEIQRRGMRRTLARRAVLEALIAVPHQTAQQVHAQMTRRGLVVDPSTVHRILDALAEIGALHALPGATGTTYGPADEPHHHTICTACGRIRELSDPRIPALIATLDDPHADIRIDALSYLVLYARCRDCIDDSESDR